MKPTWNETPFSLNVNPNASPRPLIRGESDFTKKNEGEASYKGGIASE